MRNVTLGDICSKASSNVSQKDIQSNTGAYPIYGASGFIKTVDFYHQEQAYIAIVKDGAGIGRAMLLPARSSVIGTMQYILPSELVDIKYLYYAIVHMNLSKYYTGAAIPHIYFKDYRKEPLKLPILSEQRRISVILEKIDAVMGRKSAQLENFNQAVKSRFIELFGDMMQNPRQWQELPLSSLANIASGITKGRKIRDNELMEVPYMAVSNVKAGYIDWTLIKTILATKQEIEQYRLMPKDILMTEGGDPDKLGRGAIIENPPKDCIHQNHIFRVRVNCERVIPEFFEEYLQHQRAKRYFSGCAKQTTGIASISMTQLRNLPVIIPPLPLQYQFAIFVEQTDKSKYYYKIFRKTVVISYANIERTN